MVSGSPYYPKVVDPRKIRVSGGWRPLLDEQERIPLVVGKEKHIPFDAADAGPGTLMSRITRKAQICIIYAKIS